MKWFSLRYLNGKFIEEMTMEQVILKTGLVGEIFLILTNYLK